MAKTQQWYTITTMPPLDDQSTILSKRELTFGYWVATHRPLLHSIVIGFFSLIAGGMTIIFILNTVNWATHIQQTNDILSDLSGSDVNYGSIRRPQPISVMHAVSAMRDDKSIDLLVDVKNTNDIWAATAVTYQIELAGKTLGPYTVSLAPLEEKFLTQQAIPFTGSTAPAVKATVLNTVWQKYADISRLPTDNWVFANAHYGYVQTSSDTAPFKTELIFTLENKSVYGFRDVQVVVELQDSSGNVQGIASVILDTMLTTETRALTFRWPLRLPTNVTPVIHVNVDHLDESSIIRTRQE